MVSAPRQTQAEERVAIDVAALQVGPADERAFVADLPLALRDAGGFDVTAWTSEPGGVRSLPGGAEPAGHRWRGTVARAAIAAGMTASAAWVAGDNGLIHLASGPRPLRVGAPGVITMHHALPSTSGSRTSRREARVREATRRSVDLGAVIHVVSRTIADEVVERMGVDRDRVVVAPPGIAARADDREDSAGPMHVTVLRTRQQDRDAEIDARLGATGKVTTSVGEDADHHARCLVIAAPLDGFSAAAVSAMAAGIPIVAVRSPDAVELLTGVATFVEPSELDELIDIAVSLAGHDGARAINVAAGLARAADFAWERRVPAIISLYRLALAGAR